ncbi:glycoside hydrolase [Lindgomyces ingoldianus]|uniref:Glycoside hydrolase n=1 Tax=Lindgomyces ingoldianus TaxID=673940 RepID=A0ACB6QQ47_9PLEO|nr:glycoside hydrolase [Lindgomyces ingoldianus]KAF2469144.1 glycoside hydrolase [Lindgomyces ingoldianus]
MRLSLLAASTAALSTPILAFDIDTTSPPSIKSSASTIASSIVSMYPNKALALLSPPSWWWQSGLTLDGLTTYYHTTGDAQYNDLIARTLQSQATGSNDFMTPDATGNDDQAWWALAAMSAAEYGIPSPAGSPSFLAIAQNVFNEQKSRWDNARCNGGMKWKINPSDDGYHYKSTISNGLFFQLAARIARFTGDADAASWASKSYDWVVSVGLIDGSYNVFDGTDDAKGTGCVDVNHDLWSYNTGVFLYGAAVMADKTGDAKWSDRAKGFLGAAEKSFVRNGGLFEQKCEGDGSCNTDQKSFKAALARWMGASATLLPELAGDVQKIIGQAARAVSGGWTQSWGPGEQLAALDMVDAVMCGVGQGAPGKPRVGKRKIGRAFIA